MKQHRDNGQFVELDGDYMSLKDGVIETGYTYKGGRLFLRMRARITMDGKLELFPDDAQELASREAMRRLFKAIMPNGHEAISSLVYSPWKYWKFLHQDEDRIEFLRDIALGRVRILGVGKKTRDALSKALDKAGFMNRMEDAPC